MKLKLSLIPLMLLFWPLCDHAQDKLGPPPVDEVGVYFQSNGKWVDVPPEVVNWKTGGVLKNVGTLGVVKGDVNGKIKGGTSKTHLLQPIELLVYAPEGTAITEYQLIKLRTHSDSREFRTVTGGVFHVSGGAERDTLDFTSKRIAQRTWTIFLGDLKPGEYGLLPPGMSDARSASAQLGKIYSFSIPENAVKFGGSSSVMTITPMTSEQIAANKTQSDSPAPQPPNPSSQAQPSYGPSTMAISSTPPGADIFVDQDFIGNAPSTVSIGPGKHVISLKKSGFRDWTRNINFSGGSVTVHADLTSLSN